MNWRPSIYSVFRSMIGNFKRYLTVLKKMSRAFLGETKRQVPYSFTQPIVLNLFSSPLFYTDYTKMLENEKRAPGGCQAMSWCSTAANCYGSDAGGSYELTPGDCGPNTVCCTYFVM